MCDKQRWKFSPRTQQQIAAPPSHRNIIEIRRHRANGRHRKHNYRLPKRIFACQKIRSDGCCLTRYYFFSTDETAPRLAISVRSVMAASALYLVSSWITKGRFILQTVRWIDLWTFRTTWSQLFSCLVQELLPCVYGRQMSFFTYAVCSDSLGCPTLIGKAL